MFRMAMLPTATIAVAPWLALIGGVAAPYQWWALAGIGAATIASLAYGWHIAQCVIKPLEGAAKIARQVAAGNLQIAIDTDQQGEVGNLYFYLDMMRNSLFGIVNDAHHGADATTNMAIGRASWRRIVCRTRRTRGEPCG